MLARLSGQTPWQVTCPNDLYILRFQKADFYENERRSQHCRKQAAPKMCQPVFLLESYFLSMLQSGEKTTMEFFNQAITVLQTLVVAIGAGLGVWGVVNLMEGYGNDNPGAKSQGMKRFIPN